MKNAFTIQNGVATVRLTQDKSTRVAELALPFLATHRWCAVRAKWTWYAATTVRRPDGRRTMLMLHRLLCGLDFGDPREVDHIDGDGLNNLPSNLRVTDGAGNQHNLHMKCRKRGEVPTSRFQGVSWHKMDLKWRAGIGLAGRRIHLGLHDREEDAAEAYLRAKAVRDAGGTETEVRATRSHILSKRRWCDGRAPTSAFPGVCWNRRNAKWLAQIYLAGRGIHLGLYNREEDAAEAYTRAKAVRGAGGTEGEVKATRGR
jgi:hypothetical protein